MITKELLTPFGLVVRVSEGTAWSDVPESDVHAWLAEHRVVVFRGLPPFAKADLPGAARRLGPLQAWDFGAVNELEVKEGTKNYLFTPRAVPLHWDGAFTPEPPRYLFFQCLRAPEPDAGGETLFVDTARVWKRADQATRDLWGALSFSYETAKVAHYGGRFSARLVSQHPCTGETVLRFAEPVFDLNPVTVSADALSPVEGAALVTSLRAALMDPEVVLAHLWQKGDVVIADNFALLHGRRAFERSTPRHIQRVNVHDTRVRTWRDAVADSVRIRRPEFMVAEIPILLVPALLATGDLGDVAPSIWAALTALFFLLFHFGDMINCLADRDLDAVYKTRLSEAVYGLGVANVKKQIAATAILALGLSGYLAWRVSRIDLVALVAFGLLLGAAYSVPPLRLKGRGVAQVLTLWALIFVGPMLLAARTLGAPATSWLAGFVAAYGAMQQGIIVVNTAEDLPEDEASGIETTAVALGLDRTVGLALAMATLGGAGVLGSLADRGASALALAPLFLAWAWVTWELWALSRAVRDRDVAAAVAQLRPRARRMPLWITATAWGTLFAAALCRAFAQN